MAKKPDKGLLDLSNWMKYLKGDVKVVDSYIPGSHDASAYPYNGGGQWYNWFAGSVTQASNYYAQLRAGSRYFDMRVQRYNPLSDDITLVMHHGKARNTFERLVTVLKEIKRFMDLHPDEFVFLDFDFPYGPRDTKLETELERLLTEQLGGAEGNTDKFSTAHVIKGGDNDGWYNTALTWDMLRKEKKQYIIIWQSQTWITLPERRKYWAPDRDRILENPDGDFDQMQPSDIVKTLDKSLYEWTRLRLRITDLVNTPSNSLLHHPADLDAGAHKWFEPWLLSKNRGDGKDPKGAGNLGIVRRDFVNKIYNRRGTEHIVAMNQFTSGSAPLKTPDTKINCLRSTAMLDNSWNILLWETTERSLLSLRFWATEDVYLIGPDGSHVFVDVKYEPEKSLVSVAMPEMIPKGDDVFMAQSYYPTATWAWAFSGEGHDEIKKSGVRFVHHDTRTGDKNVGDKVVLSVGTEQGLGEQLWWGQWQEDADNLETFYCFDPDNLDSWDGVCDGSSVVIRSMNSRKWLVIISDPNTKKVGLFASATEINDATVFTVRLVNRPVH